MIASHLFAFFFNTTPAVVGDGSYFASRYFDVRYFQQMGSGTVPIDGMVFPTMAVEAELSGVGGGWTELTADVNSSVPIVWDDGIDGNDLEDRVASPGEMTFALNNNTHNVAGTLGYYSPDHASLRTGFRIGINIRFVVFYAGQTWPQFYGRLAAIKPITGQHGARLTMCLVRDWMDEASRAKLKRIPVQQFRRADQILTTVVDAMPRQPSTRSFTAGTDTYVVALDHSPEEGAGVLEEFQRIAQTEVGYIFVRHVTPSGPDLVFESRATRAGKTANLSTFDDTMVELEMSRDREDIVTRLQVVNHPKRFDLTNEILFNLRDANVSDSTTIALAPGQTRELVCPYTDHANRNTRIGAISNMVIPPVAYTDFRFDSDPGGAGIDLTGYLAVTAEFGATAAFVTLTNTLVEGDHAAVVGYVVFFQIRGPGIYDEQEQIFERIDDVAEEDYGEQTQTYDMPYQSDPNVADGAARYFLALKNTEVTNVQGLRVFANRTATQMTNTLMRSIGDRVGVAETASGLTTDTGFFIQSRHGEYHEGNQFWMRWGLAPASRARFWLLGTPGVSELGATTILGF